MPGATMEAFNGMAEAGIKEGPLASTKMILPGTNHITSPLNSGNSVLNGNIETSATKLADKGWGTRIQDVKNTSGQDINQSINRNCQLLDKVDKTKDYVGIQ